MSTPADENEQPVILPVPRDFSSIIARIIARQRQAETGQQGAASDQPYAHLAGRRAIPVQLLYLNPGNGASYRLLIGTLPGPMHTLFGFAEGENALITLLLESKPLSFLEFCQRIRTAQFCEPQTTPTDIEHAAYAIYAALAGIQAEAPSGWQPGWEHELAELVLF